MNRLFIHFYLDEDVSTLVARLLRSRGFEATTTLEAGNVGASDAAQLAFAASNEFAVLTHNRVHFELLAREYLDAGKHHCGIVIAVRRPAAQIAERLLILLDEVSAEEMCDQLRYI